MCVCVFLYGVLIFLSVFVQLNNIILCIQGIHVLKCESNIWKARYW